MKMFDFEGRGGSKISKFGSRNGFGRKKNSNRSKKVVAKRLGKTFWTENGASPARGPEGRGLRKGGKGGWKNPSLRDGFEQFEEFLFEERL